MNNQLYESLYKNIKTPYILLEKREDELIILDVNDAFEDYFLLKRKDIVNQNYNSIFNYRVVDDGKYYAFCNKFFSINIIKVNQELVFFEYIDKTDEVKFTQENDELLSSLNDIVLEFSDDYVLVKVVAKDENKLYKNIKSLIGKKISEIYATEQAIYFTNALEKAKNSLKPVTIEYQLEVSSISKWYQADIKYISKFEDKKYTIIIKDINDLKEEKLRADYYENELKSQIALRDFLFDLSTELVLSNTKDINEVVNNCLRKLGDYIKADRVYVVEYLYDQNIARNTYEWVADNISSAIENLQNISFELIKPWLKLHQKGENLYIKDVSLLDDSEIKEVLVSQDIKSLITLPMMYKNTCYGFLGFDYVRDYKVYNQDEKDIFTEFGNLLMGVLITTYYEKALRESEQKFRQITENMADVVWTTDLDLNITYITPSIYDLTGFTVSEFEKIKFEERFTGESIENLDFRINARIEEYYKTKKNEAFTVEAELLTKNGGSVWVELKMIFLIENEKIFGLQGSARNINIRKKALEDLSIEKELLKTTLLAVADGVITTDKLGNITLMNQVASNLTGYKIEEVIGKSCKDIFNTYDSKTNKPCEHSFKEVFEKKVPIGPFDDTMLRSKNNLSFPIEAIASPILDKKEEVIGIVLVFRDITDKKKKEEKILYLSYNDFLTTLNNRRYFEEKIADFDCEANLPLSIVMIDVNGLKLINDAFGHLVGDVMLQKIARQLKENTRSRDLIARVGGDEFILVLPNTSSSQVKEIVNRISKKVNQEKISDINLSIACGFETKTLLTENIMDVFKKAEGRMYKHKLSESQSMRYNTLDVIMKTLYEKSKREEIHSKRVSSLCEKLGIAMGLESTEIHELKMGGLMHDIGKIIIPDEILNKPSKLTEEEWVIVKKHPETGYKILGSINEFASLASSVLEHHERWDGKGYPQKLKRNEISLNARIITVADAYDSMTNSRPYNVKRSNEEAIVELQKNSGTQFDPKIVEIFIDKVLKNSVNH